MNLLKVLWLSVFALTVFGSVCGFAEEGQIGVARVFTDESGAKLFIAPYGKAQDNTYLVRFEGFNNAWDGKVILHHLVKTVSHTKYVISIPTGNKFRPTKSFETIIDSQRKILQNGSVVPVIEVYLPKHSNPETMQQTATDQSASADMLKTFQTQNFKVDF